MNEVKPTEARYRGRLAPSPTGLLHLGHARTFWIAQKRCRERNGQLVLRNDDLDRARCQPEFVTAMLEDLHWLGLGWDEGPDVGGPFAPYSQSERISSYRKAFECLIRNKRAYPCTCSRQDVVRATQAPHAGDDEPLYPGTCRPGKACEWESLACAPLSPSGGKQKLNWRFLVPGSRLIAFQDAHFGCQQFEAGKDFGDFVVWRHDDLPSYQLATTVDDAEMRITEVVRGEDLLRSTARQLLLYEALNLKSPTFRHCQLVKDQSGERLAKRDDSLSLRSLRTQGRKPAEIIAGFSGPGI
jgi:glutamyl-tRNA synthetase